MSEQQPIERQRMRDLRGRIIRTLHHFYASKTPALGFETIRHTVDHRAWTVEEIRAALRYLVSAGYVGDIERKRDALDENPFTVFELTPKGIQLVGGEISDTSIEVALPHD